MEKRYLDRRLQQMEAEGVVFRAGVHIGQTMPIAQIRTEYDAVVLAMGAAVPRDLPIPGRELSGIHFAMDYLTQQNRRNEGDQVPGDQVISAAGKRVVIIGGGDTGADCLGAVHRQGAASVHQFELLPQPPPSRTPHNPWPEWPHIFRVSAAHEEGGERVFAVSTQRFAGDESGRLTQLHAVTVERRVTDGRMSFAPVPGTEVAMDVDLVLLAMGFVGAEKGGLVNDLGVTITDRGNVWTDERWMTNVPGVFAAGDVQRGQSLIVWAIAEGRSAAQGVDAYLMGASDLPVAVVR
jgi:glutamate synthase (NADPH/NADH) small chain